MTDICSALLALLDRPQEWEYSSTFESMSHAATKITLGPVHSGRVFVLCDRTNCSDALAPEEHAVLHETVSDLIRAHQRKPDPAQVLRRALGLSP